MPDPTITDELAAARAELDTVRTAIREDGINDERQAAVDDLIDTIERLEGGLADAAAPASTFTEEELEKISEWARTPGVPVSSLPLEYRAAVERRRDELAAETPAGTAPVFADFDQAPAEEAQPRYRLKLPGSFELPVSYAQRIDGIRLTLATYHARRIRLANLEVRDTQAARQAKTELELGEALEALEAIQRAIEEA